MKFCLYFVYIFSVSVNFDASFYKSLLSGREFHENWHSNSPALLMVLHVMLVSVFVYHENLCAECHTLQVGINEIIFTHVPWRRHCERKEHHGKGSVLMWSTLLAILLLWISFSLKLTSEIKKIVNLNWDFEFIVLWVKISYFVWWAIYMCCWLYNAVQLCCWD